MLNVDSLLVLVKMYLLSYTLGT